MEDRTPVEDLRAATEAVSEAQAKIEDVLARLEALAGNATPLITEPEALAGMINAFKNALHIGSEVRSNVIQAYTERLLNASVSGRPGLAYEVMRLNRALYRAGITSERVQDQSTVGQSR